MDQSAYPSSGPSPQSEVVIPFGSRQITLSLERLLTEARHHAEEELVQFRKREKPELFNSHPIDIDQVSIETFSLRGPSHIAQGFPNQDALAVKRNHNSIVAAVSDGVSSGIETHEASAFLSRSACEICSELVSRLAGNLSEEHVLVELLAELHARLYVSLVEFCYDKAQKFPTSEPMVYGDATLELLIVMPDVTLVLSLGDGLFREGESIERVESRFKRTFKNRHSDANIPPLLVHVAQGRVEAPYEFLLGMEASHEELKQEAKAFRLVARMPSGPCVQKGVGIYTDGAEATSLLSGEVSDKFPLAQLLESKALSADEISAWCAIWDLSVGISRLENAATGLCCQLGAVYRQGKQLTPRRLERDIQRALPKLGAQHEEFYSELQSRLLAAEALALSPTLAPLSPVPFRKYGETFSVDCDPKKILRILERTAEAPLSLIPIRIRALLQLREGLHEALLAQGIPLQNHSPRIRDDISGVFVQLKN